MEDMVKDGWRQIYERGGEQAGADSFETFWEDILKAGVWGETTRRDQAFTLDSTVISGIGVPEAEFSGAAEEFPFMLHPYESAAFQDGRGANLPWMQELPDPLTSVVYGSWVEMNPVTASELGLTEGDLVDIVSPHGQLRAPVFVYPAIRPDVIAMPIGQGHSEYGRYAKERGVNPIEILSPLVETGTGALAINATRVSVVATGQHVDLIKTGGNSRELGREIVPTTSTSSS
ncbi:MAG: hypothetical protein GTO60_04605, partial [Gammaproteobacteria bacterium]|nr:hypothetical protein [Gammaproteobacteria bacterium]NIO63633.1 hypothetical protein [Gammaproteobacteria bacterium]